jgi:hypothetical protein
MKSAYIIAAMFVVILASCKKEDDPSGPIDKLAINISYNVDGVPLAWDTLLYTNNAGNKYSVSKLQYYLSGFRFYRNGQMYYKSDSVFYVDARKNTSAYYLEGMPYLKYDSIAFYVGVAPEYNLPNALPATLENTAMIWPETMGGGYHFMKMEGHWRDAGNQYPGFAMHIGNTEMLVRAGIRCDMSVQPTTGATLNMSMNVNEWFRNPTTYDFSTDGVYIMGNTVLMRKISDNGADVFKAN